MSIPSATNCPNCGAPIDISRSSCEYCGTPYGKSNDIHIEVTAPDPSVEDFAEVLSRISRRSGFNLNEFSNTNKYSTGDYSFYDGVLYRCMDSDTLYANNQPVYSQVRQSIQATQQELLSGMASATAWKPSPEEERKMIEDMRNVAPTIFPKIEPTVEYIKYNTKLERLMDTVWFWFAALIATIGCALLPFIIF